MLRMRYTVNSAPIFTNRRHRSYSSHRRRRSNVPTCGATVLKHVSQGIARAILMLHTRPSADVRSSSSSHTHRKPYLFGSRDADKRDHRHRVRDAIFVSRSQATSPCRATPPTAAPLAATAETTIARSKIHSSFFFFFCLGPVVPHTYIFFLIFIFLNLIEKRQKYAPYRVKLTRKLEKSALSQASVYDQM